MEEAKTVLLILTFCISVFNSYLLYRFRKKDFQLAILKEQLAAYSDLLENLFQTKESLNALYKKSIDDKLFTADGYFVFDKLEENQKKVFEEFGNEYDRSFSRFQRQIFLLPEDVIDATMEYYTYMHDLFEKNNDINLGNKLLTELNQKVFDVVNVIRIHIAIDDLTNETRKLLTSKQQLQFVREEELES